jgi:hypothetical protein
MVSENCDWFLFADGARVRFFDFQEILVGLLFCGTIRETDGFLKPVERCWMDGGMKYLTKKRIVWAAAALGLLLLGKIFIYDELIRCNLSQSSLDSSPPATQPPLQVSSVLPPTPLTQGSPVPVPEVVSLREKIEAQLASASLLFDPTIRSCLGSKCFDMPAKGVDRIGLLAPPNSGAEVLLRTIKRVKPNLDSEKAEILYESAVPAYGYGKNHGWSRIVRFVRSPILQALQLLSEEQILEPSVLESQVRQLVRWHCRLSHVAAHTRMLTGEPPSRFLLLR